MFSTAARAWLTGQLALASWAAAWKSSSDSPGTVARTVSLMAVMPSPGWKVTSARVSTFSTVWPLPARPWEKAME
jgi:hypothetical protein